MTTDLTTFEVEVPLVSGHTLHVLVATVTALEAAEGVMDVLSGTPFYADDIRAKPVAVMPLSEPAGYDSGDADALIAA